MPSTVQNLQNTTAQIVGLIPFFISIVIFIFSKRWQIVFAKLLSDLLWARGICRCGYQYREYRSRVCFPLQRKKEMGVSPIRADHFYYTDSFRYPNKMARMVQHLADGGFCSCRDRILVCVSRGNQKIQPPRRHSMAYLRHTDRLGINRAFQYFLYRFDRHL